MSSTAPAKKKKSPHVPGQYLGYSLQSVRCLVRLLKVPPGSYVSVEVFEDVGVIGPDGSCIAEQDKSALEGNPVADRSVDLWKTLCNWVDAIKCGAIDPSSTYFEIFVTPRRRGKLVSNLSSAETVEEARALVSGLRTDFWGAAPDFHKKSKLAATLAPYVNTVLGNPTVFQDLIMRFRLAKGSPDCYGEARQEIQKCYPGEAVDDILHFALGWVKGDLDKKLQTKQPAVIEADVFREQLFAFVLRTDPRRVLRCFAADPTHDQIESEKAVRTYVKQLVIIDCGHDDQLRAIIDFFKSATNRTVWSAKGWINQGDLKTYETRLVDAWHNLRLKNRATNSHLPETARGQALLAECMLHECPMTQAELPNGFTRGSFHALADALEVGWHPNYRVEVDAEGN